MISWRFDCWKVAQLTPSRPSNHSRVRVILTGVRRRTCLVIRPAGSVLLLICAWLPAATAGKSRQWAPICADPEISIRMQSTILLINRRQLCCCAQNKYYLLILSYSSARLCVQLFSWTQSSAKAIRTGSALETTTFSSQSATILVASLLLYVVFLDLNRFLLSLYVFLIVSFHFLCM